MSSSTINSIKFAREKAGLTQKEVEAALDLRKLMMKDYETGRIKLPVEVALKLADLYHLTLDELVNYKSQSHSLIKLETLFQRSELDLIFTDPVIRSFAETYSEKMFNCSIFEILVIELNKLEREEFQMILFKYLYSLIGIDDKVMNSELNFVNSIGVLLSVKIQPRKFQEYLVAPYNPESLSRVLKENLVLRHFIVWMMFFLAKSDGEISFTEKKYIEQIAENLKILKSNYILINKNFEKEIKA